MVKKSDPPDPPPPDLFDWAHARASDPATSHEAAASINITAQALRVLLSYHQTDRALLDHDAYRLAGFSANRFSHQRCSDLRTKGLIERTGARAETPSGHSGYVCRITHFGRVFLTGRG
jgi:hypothetical protein